MSVTRRPVGRRVVEAHHHNRALSKSTPLECLRRSRYVMMTLFKPGDTMKVGDGPRQRIIEKLRDEDGEIVFVFEDGSHLEVPGPTSGEVT